MTFIATSFLRTARLKYPKLISSCRTPNLSLSIKTSVPCRTFHATPSAHFRPSRRSNVRGYYGPNQNYSRNSGFSERARKYFFNPDAVVYGIIGINIGVWIIAWCVICSYGSIRNTHSRYRYAEAARVRVSLL